MNTEKIGSEFNLPFSNFIQKRKFCPKRNHKYLSSGRDSIEAIIQNIQFKKNEIILFPSYLCPSIMQQFKNKKIKYLFYRLNKKLEIDLKDIEKNIRHHDIKAIIIIHYFGFIQPKINKIRELCNKKNVILIEDLTQSYLTNYNPVGDYYFNSYRKLLAIPDGSMLGFKKSIETKYKTSINNLLFKVIRLFSLLAYNITFFYSIARAGYTYGETKLIEKYKKPSRMSALSLFLLKRQDIKKMIKKRRKNYLFLLANFPKNKNFKILFNKLPKTVTPSGFPILCKKREKIMQHFLKKRIYPPIHWNIKKIKGLQDFKESIQISRKILTIPIDQRYNKTDMQRIIQVLKENE